MSIDNAREFLSKLREHDGDAWAILPKDIAFGTIGSAEIAVIATAAIAAGWDFTADELQESYLESLAVEDDELAAVAGGASYIAQDTKAQGPGGCKSNYYAEQCSATVEKGSFCVCTDYRSGRYNHC